MFARNGPLGIAWLAAHLERKVLKKQVNETNISALVEEILLHSPVSLRVLAHLLLGIARIYSQKVSFTLTLCSETVEQLKKTQLSILVNNCSEVAVARQLLFGQDNFDEFIGSSSDEQQSVLDLYVARPEQITLQQNHDHNGFNLYFDPDDRLPACTLRDVDLQVDDVNGKSHSIPPEEAELDMNEPVADIYFEPRTPPSHVSADHIVRPSHDSPLQRLPWEHPEHSPPARTALNFDKLVDVQEARPAAEHPQTSPERITDAENVTEPSKSFKSLKRKYSYCSKTARKRKRIILDVCTVLTSEFLHKQNLDTEDLLRPHSRVPCTYRELFMAQKQAEKSKMFSKLSVAGVYSGQCQVTLSLETISKRSCALNYHTSSPVKGLVSPVVTAAAHVEADVLKELAQPVEAVAPVVIPYVHLNVSTELSQPVEAAGLDENFDMSMEWGSELVEQEYEEDKSDSSEWSSRTRALLLFLNKKLKRSSAKQITFDQLVTKTTRRSAACMFFDVLVLKSRDRIHVEQTSPFDDIIIVPLDL